MYKTNLFNSEIEVNYSKFRDLNLDKKFKSKNAE